ncbi:nuclear GTPase SLIP-GC-like [Anableps anableps]
MVHTHRKLQQQDNNKLNNFLKNKIIDLSTDKREMVGVFGKTGAGKSSLINAVIGQINLLPSGDCNACTSVMIKVEAGMNNKYEAEIEFITREAEMLSEGIAKYTRNDSSQGESKELKRLYWPLVKCVTVKVPKIALLQHVTLVDLPGNGDRNKSRDEMWKGIVGKCSTVWIVAEITRAAAEQQCWEILKSAASHLGNGGECQYIHFICTKSDHFEDFRDHSAEDRLALILKRNMKAKEEVKTAFSRLVNVKKQFSEDSFEVFTVSSKEFLKGGLKENTEIPKLQKFLQDLNDCHSETLNYVSGAYGILSLIQGTTLRDTRNCQGFWVILQRVVQNGGIYKPKKKNEINLNKKLTSPLTNSIDEEFRKTFPNKGKSGPFSGVISRFSLNTEKLKQKYNGVELQLTFLKTEEEKVQSELNKMIRDRKKTVYSSLTKTIEETMQECYKKAARFEKTDTLKNMRETIQNHVTGLKDTMFEKAKNVMLTELKSLADNILETIESTMEESLELSLRTDDHSIPDVSTELEMVQKLYDELKSNTKEKML